MEDNCFKQTNAEYFIDSGHSFRNNRFAIFENVQNVFLPSFIFHLLYCDLWTFVGAQWIAIFILDRIVDEHCSFFVSFFLFAKNHEIAFRIFCCDWMRSKFIKNCALRLVVWQVIALRPMNLFRDDRSNWLCGNFLNC